MFEKEQKQRSYCDTGDMKAPLHSFRYSNLLFGRNKISCLHANRIRWTACLLHLRLVKKTARSPPTSIKKSYKKMQLKLNNILKIAYVPFIPNNTPIHTNLGSHIQSNSVPINLQDQENGTLHEKNAHKSVCFHFCSR